MVYFVFLLVTLLASASHAGVFSPGGGAGGGSATIETGTALPGTCTPGSTNALFLDTDDELLYFCSSTDTFVQVNPTSTDTIDTVFDRGGTITGAVSFETALKLLDANNDGWAWYVDPTDGPIFVCVDNNVEGGCTSYTRKLAAGQTLAYKNSSGTNIFTLTESTGAITNATLDTEGTGNTVTMKRYKWIPAGLCNNATASTTWDLPTSSPAVAACRTGTNTQKAVLEFADGANLTAQYNEYLHEDWSGAIDATIIYEANSTSTNNTVWQLAIACAGDGDSDDPTFTDDAFTADAGKATAHQYNATAVNTITTTGTCTAGDMMHIRLRRDSAHASDNLAATAKFVGLSLKLREAQ